MNIHRLLIPAVLALFILAFTSPSPAQASVELPNDRPLTLEECIQFALEHHNSILAAEKDLAGSQAEVSRARAGYMPRITIGTSYDQWGSEGNQGGTGSRPGNSHHRTEIGVHQTIFDGGRTQTTIRQTSAMHRAAEADVERIMQERILAVTVAYFDVLRTNRLADIAAQAVDEAEGQRRLIQARIDAGDAAQVDIYPVEVQLANAKLQRLQADNSARVAAGNLRNAMGLSSNFEISLADVDEPTWMIPSMDECTAWALDERPELVRSDAQIESARAALSLARSQTAPIPTAGINYDRGLGGTSYDNQWSIGVGLSMNLFDGGAASADVKRVRSSVDSLELRDSQTRLDIAREVEEAYLNLSNALERLDASSSNVALATTNLEVTNERYRQGLAIPLEVVSAQVSHADAQAGYAQALYDCYTARARLDKAMGRREY